jgi:hypothetical protein
MPTRREKVRLGAIVFAILVFAGWYWRYGGPWKLEPKADWTIAFAKSIADNQDITIPKAAGVIKSPRLNVRDDPIWNATYVGLPSGWTPIANGNDSGHLLVDVTRVPLFGADRYGIFQYIPKPHTIDENINKPILYEIVNDAFRCADGTAAKQSLTVIYEDGTELNYSPWGAAIVWGIWIPVKPGTALSREMKFICAVELTRESKEHSTLKTSSMLDANRMLGTWQVEHDVQGRIAAAPIVISEQQIAWMTDDNRKCVSDYELASRSGGSAYPGASLESGDPAVEYTTFVLELKGEATKPCGQGMNSFTISFKSDQRDLAHFAAFRYAVQGYGTLRRVSSDGSIP